MLVWEVALLVSGENPGKLPREGGVLSSLIVLQCWVLSFGLVKLVEVRQSLPITEPGSIAQLVLPVGGVDQLPLAVSCCSWSVAVERWQLVRILLLVLQLAAM